MNILILGSGGREHALAVAYSKSKKVNKVFVAPGNGLIDFQNEKAVNLYNVKALDFDAILAAVKKYKIDLVDVAQDDPLAAGFVDKLEKLGIQAFGPTQSAAQIEWSKDWSRIFMMRYKLPIPHFQSFTNEQKAVSYINSLEEQILYIKASGLAAGKGAIRSENKKQALEAIKLMKQFGTSGETFLIEECLIGEEFSLFAICDGDHYQIINVVQDHKTLFNADQGPNTGGMGCVVPAGVLNASMIRIIEAKILKPFMQGMQREERPYKGILYLGGMINSKKGIKIVEFNARWGDPEAEVILPGIQSDYLEIVVKAMEGKLYNSSSERSESRNNSSRQALTVTPMDIDSKIRISVAGCSRGYPNDYSAIKGKEIFGLIEASKLPGITIYGAGIKREGKRFFANGGRVFHLVAEGATITQARVRAYGAMTMISIEGNNLHYRTDIGWRDVARNVKSTIE